MPNDDGLDKTATDRAAEWSEKIADSLAGLVPGGPLLAKLLKDAAIPEDRVDRIVARLRKLHDKMQADSERLDVLEEQAALMQLTTAALSASADKGPARKDRVVEILLRGLEGDARLTAYATEALTRLKGLTDIQLITLASFHPHFSENGEWMRQHRDLIGDPVSVEAMGRFPGVKGRGLGSHPASPDGEAAKAQLLGQGLLKTLPVHINSNGRQITLLRITDLGARVLEMALG